MRTDQAIYEFLATGPEAYRALTGGLLLPGPYRFDSVTFKNLERRLDAIFDPADPKEPVRLLEFQGLPSRTARPNLMTKMGLYGEAHPERSVRGLLVFLHQRLDLDRSAGVGRDEDWHWQVVYLNQFLPEWLEREPDNPHLAVLASLVLPKRRLRQWAHQLWQAIQQAPMPLDVRNVLEEVLLAWFGGRFKTITPEEIKAMLNMSLPFENTRLYQEIFAQGEARGEARGEAKSLKRLLTQRFGTLPGWTVKRIDEASLAELDTWLDSLLTAESLTSLLGSGPH
ncbi:DUF4351 domain-containing protein [Gammaproteobacteria bacterium]